MTNDEIEGRPGRVVGAYQCTNCKEWLTMREGQLLGQYSLPDGATTEIILGYVCPSCMGLNGANKAESENRP